MSEKFTKEHADKIRAITRGETQVPERPFIRAVIYQPTAPKPLPEARVVKRHFWSN